MSFTLDAVLIYVLTLMLLALLFLVLLLRTKVQEGGVPLWLAGGVFGVLLGGALSVVLANFMGYKIVGPADAANEAAIAAAGLGPDGPASGAGAAGGAAGGGGGGAMMGPGMMGPGGGGGGGGRRGETPAPTAKSELTSLVRKLELLTGDIEINLSPDQGARVAAICRELKERPTLTEEEARTAYEDLHAVLDEEQKARQEAIRVPPRAGRSFPLGPGPHDLNPFEEGADAETVETLTARLGGAPPASDGATDPTPSDPAAADSSPGETPAAREGEEKPADGEP